MYVCMCKYVFGIYMHRLIPIVLCSSLLYSIQSHSIPIDFILFYSTTRVLVYSILLYAPSYTMFYYIIWYHLMLCYVYACMHACMYVYTHMYIYIYIYTLPIYVYDF